MAQQGEFRGNVACTIGELKLFSSQFLESVKDSQIKIELIKCMSIMYNLIYITRPNQGSRLKKFVKTSEMVSEK